MVLREFEKCGIVLRHVLGPRDANWVHILYQVTINSSIHTFSCLTCRCEQIVITENRPKLIQCSLRPKIDDTFDV
jgi:hypothetical protein